MTGLSRADADFLVNYRDMADYFEECVNINKLAFAHKLCNFLKREVNQTLKEESITILDFREKVPPQNLVELLSRMA